MVAAAGKTSTRLPEDDNPRPATRTPGTITSVHSMRPTNRGRSIQLWFLDRRVGPGDRTFRDPERTQHLRRLELDGTSASAPFVSGILAMMRAVAPISTLDPPRAKQILHIGMATERAASAWGSNAYAAVLAAMGGGLPDEAASPYNTPQTARPLTAGDGAYWSFRLATIHAVTCCTLRRRMRIGTVRRSRPSRGFDLQLRFYSLLGAVSVTLEPDEPFQPRTGRDRESHPLVLRLIGFYAPALTSCTSAAR